MSRTIITAASSALPRGQIGDIYLTLRDRICTLDYPPGSKLAEQELAQEFDVSRTPIRQALQRLEYEGFTETKRGVGTTVRVFDRATFDDIFGFRLRLSELIGEFPDFSSVDDARKSVETLTSPARKAISARDMEGFWRLNHDLQFATSRLIANRSLRETHERYYFQACRIWYSVIDDIFDEQSADFLAEIDEIAGALKIADIRAIGFIQRNHISLGMQRILSSVNFG